MRFWDSIRLKNDDLIPNMNDYSICISTVHIAKFALGRQKNLLKHNTHNIWIQARLIISIIISNTDDGLGTIVISDYEPEQCSLPFTFLERNSTHVRLGILKSSRFCINFAHLTTNIQL